MLANSGRRGLLVLLLIVSAAAAAALAWQGAWGASAVAGVVALSALIGALVPEKPAGGS